MIWAPNGPAYFRRMLYRPMKEAVTVRLDADVVHWLKRDGKGYQTRLNAILRREMERSGRKAA